MEEEQKNKTQEPVKEETHAAAKKQGKITRGIQNIIGGDVLSNNIVLNNLPYLLFIATLAIFYIGNTYYSEKTFKQIEKVQNELKELRYQSITVKARMLDIGKQTEIAKKVTGMGIKGTITPPYKIFYSKAILKKETDTISRNP